MNLWLRMLWMLLTLRLRPRASMFDTTTLRMRALPNDIDFNGHVNNGRYFTLADLGRLDYVVRTGSGRVAIARRAWPIVGDAMAKFRKDIKPFQRFELHTRLLGWDERWTFMEHRFVRNGRVLGTVVMRGLFRTAEGVVKPETFLHWMGLQETSPPLPDWLIAWNAGCDSLSVALREEEAVPARLEGVPGVGTTVSGRNSVTAS